MDLFIITAPIQTGKTTWVRKMIDVAQQRSLKITGLISPAIFENGEKTGIDIELLPSRERFHFAGKAQWDFNDPAQKPDGKMRFGWDFSDEAFERANEHLKRCREDFGDLFIVDEFGGMEFFKGGGYTNGMAIMDAAEPQTVLLVLRPDLVNVATERWGEAQMLSPESSIDEFLRAIAK